MRRSFLSAIVGLGFVLGNATAAGPVPRPSPEFVIQMMPSGQKLLSQYRGKVVLLSFILTT